MSSLVDIAADGVVLLGALGDPPVGGAALSSAVQAARTFTTTAGFPGAPAPNLLLLSPANGVPRPPDDGSVQAGASADSLIGAVSAPLPVAGPPGDAGPAGDVGPPGPPGPGIAPARFAALEAAVLDLQEQIILGLVIASH